MNKEIDISRGDIICKKNSPLETADQFNINMIWMGNEKCFSGRTYIAKIHNIQSSIKILDIKKLYNVNTLENKPSKELSLNDVAEVTVSFIKNILTQITR